MSKKHSPGIRGSLRPDYEHRFQSGARLLVSTQGERPGDASAQVASVQLWVGAGTCAERDDEHGCAHLLEHMLFKPRPTGGSAHEDLATGIEALGGDVNAYTSYDETVFHATVPLSAAEDAMRVMLDTVLDPAFDPEELAKEREVVVEEILQYADDPSSAAMDELIEELFSHRDYGRPILGRTHEVRGHSAKRLAAYHRRNYAGSRLTLVVAGAVDPKRVRRIAGKRLETVPRRRVLGPLEAPNADGRNVVRVVAKDVREVHVRLGWVGPGARADDAVALDLAATALGHGESSPLSARVRRELQLVSDAHASFMPFAHGGALLVSAQTVPERVEAATEALITEVSRLARVPLERDVFRRARAQLRSALVYRRETVQGRAHSLGFFATVCGDLEAEAAYYEQLDALDPEAVTKAVANVVLGRRAVLHVVVPESTPLADAARKKQLTSHLRRALSRPSKPTKRKVLDAGQGVSMTELDGGPRVFVLPDASVPIVGGLLVWQGGLRVEPVRAAGATHLASALLTRGTLRRDGEALAREVDDMAAVLEGFAGRNSVGVQFESLADLSPTLIRRALECAALPTFEPKEFEEERRVILEELVADEDDLAHVAFRDMLGTLYGRHPYGRSVRGTADSLRGLDAHKVGKLWRAGYRMGDAALCLAGDVDPNRVFDLVAAALADDIGNPDRAPMHRADAKWPGTVPKPGKRARVHTIARKRAQAHVAIGFPGLSIGDPEQPVLDVLTTILGGASGRLFVELRERDGLVYHAGASSTEGLDAGHVSIYAATANDKLERTLDAIWAQVASMSAQLCTEAEFDRAKAWLVGNHMQGLQRRSRLASHLAFAVAYDLPLGHYFELPARIASVTREDVRSLAERLLDRRRSVSTIIRATSS